MVFGTLVMLKDAELKVYNYKYKRMLVYIVSL